jgi:hypothetical protein
VHANCIFSWCPTTMNSRDIGLQAAQGTDGCLSDAGTASLESKQQLALAAMSALQQEAQHVGAALVRMSAPYLRAYA